MESILYHAFPLRFSLCLITLTSTASFFSPPPPPSPTITFFAGDGGGEVGGVEGTWTGRGVGGGGEGSNGFILLHSISFPFLWKLTQQRASSVEVHSILLLFV